MKVKELKETEKGRKSVEVDWDGGTKGVGKLKKGLAFFCYFYF